ncbi:MAG: hypothetical protein U5N58_09270 [Actinomycetota bacterium]|nr:hypothetical protein [Actinomycetota bacterium]
MKIEIADLSGYCFGVKRALSMAEDTLKNEPGKVFTLGQIIHNPIVVNELDRKGIHSVNSIQQIPEGSLVVIRSHGLPPSAVKKLNERAFPL